MCESQLKTYPERIDSISVEKNSKGFTWSIKLYYNSTEEDADKNILDKIKNIDTELRKKFEVA